MERVSPKEPVASSQGEAVEYRAKVPCPPAWLKFANHHVRDHGEYHQALWCTLPKATMYVEYICFHSLQKRLRGDFQLLQLHGFE